MKSLDFLIMLLFYEKSRVTEKSWPGWKPDLFDSLDFCSVAVPLECHLLNDQTPASVGAAFLQLCSVLLALLAVHNCWKRR